MLATVKQHGKRQVSLNLEDFIRIQFFNCFSNFDFFCFCLLKNYIVLTQNPKRWGQKSSISHIGLSFYCHSLPSEPQMSSLLKGIAVDFQQT